MKIVTFTSAIGGSGGVQQALHQTLGLRRMGHDAVLCVPADSSIVYWVKDAGDWLISMPGKDREWKAVLEAQFGDKPAVVHAFHNRAVKLAAWWGLGWRKRGVVTVSHRGIITRPKNPLPYLSPGLKLVLANSHACARSLSWHCPPWKIRVLPNGISRERVTPERGPDEVRAELDLSREDIPLVYIGNANPVKGFWVLLEAFAKVFRRLPEARLIVLGITPESCRARLEDLGLTERVRVIASHPNVADYLQVGQALVFPSLGMDSAPNVLLEACRMGLPVISSDVGGTPEIVDGNGLLVPAGDTAALAEAMSAMCRDGEQRRAWGLRSLAVGERFSMDARCRRLEGIYHELLEKYTSRSR